MPPKLPPSGGGACILMTAVLRGWEMRWTGSQVWLLFFLAMWPLHKSGDLSKFQLPYLKMGYVKIRWDHARAGF